MVSGNKRHQKNEERFYVDHVSSWYKKGVFENFIKMAHSQFMYGDM